MIEYGCQSEPEFEALLHSKLEDGKVMRRKLSARTKDQSNGLASAKRRNLGRNAAANARKTAKDMA